MPKTVELEILIVGDKVQVLLDNESIVEGDLYSKSNSVIGHLAKYKFTIDVIEGDKG